MKQFLSQLSFGAQFTLVLAWVFVASSTVLFLPDGLAQMFSLGGIQQTSRPVLSLVVIISSSYFLAKLLMLGHHALTYKSAQEQERGRMVEMVKRLDFEEKAVLREYIIQRKNMLTLPLNEPAVNNLLEAGVLVPAMSTQEISGEKRLVKLAISLEARPLLTHKLLGLPVGKMTEEDVERLKSARPDYARQNFIGLRG
ncbi:superinfection exclusion B family protein [Motilimonas pumila]|uniref:Superinfection exclusion protein B n=1 Tax=Motilimonas pumila TaxID=2303987 RepID=A0A418YCQ9_9GAMM|nr:superinfection exclusion B family protein [Motilimonas pumila]RJG42317.1 hypothetical protein D1Z90_13645 [Motilimonas pumila]